MSATAIAARLTELAAEKNRELTLDAVITAVLGVLFTLIVFGAIYWTLFISLFTRLSGASIAFSPPAFGITAGLFACAVLMAWRQTEPLADLDPMPASHDLLTRISIASTGVPVRNSRSAMAGALAFLIGGPGNILEAIGTVRTRIRVSESLLRESVALLEKCRTRCPFREVHSPEAVLLLRRLALIKVVKGADTDAFTVTEKGRAVAVLGGHGVPDQPPRR